MKKKLKRILALGITIMQVFTVFGVRGEKAEAASYGAQTVTNTDLKNSYSSGNSLNPLRGVDVSKWQGNIDWAAARGGGVDFAIIQAGYRDKDTGALAEDPYFSQNASGAANVGMPIGLYFFSQAITVEEAKEEARWLISKAQQYKIAFPLVMDFEYKSDSNGYTGRLYNANLSRSAATAVVDAFCSTIEQAGYTSMFYANSYMLNNKMDADSLSQKYKLWLANYQNPAMTTYGQPTTVYSKAFTCFQFSSSGIVSGFSTRVDLDYYYGDASMMLPYYTDVFDPSFYAAKYPEIASACGNNAEALFKHFRNYGMAKGLQGCETFDAISYRYRYPDLENGFKDDLTAYYLHYLGYGKREGRHGTYSEEANQPYAKIKYQTHIQNIGWQEWKYNGDTAGTEGQSLRLEALNVNLDTNISGDIMYRAHVQNVGWQEWKYNGAMAGTSGKELRLEAVQMQLTGELAEKYDIYYRVHVQKLGWLDWAKNGTIAGTEGCAFRLEALQVQLVEKNAAAPGNTQQPSRTLSVITQAHVQRIGWQGMVPNGVVAGTTGQSLRVEAMSVSVSGFSGGISYKAHVQKEGWQDWSYDGNHTGTTGKGLRMEAVQIRLYGEMEELFDVYYRVHAQKIGWMGWTKNGAPAGTEGYAYRLEAVQITLVPKGSAAPGSTANAYRKK